MNTKLSFKQIFIAGLIAAGASAVINAILFFIFHAAGILTDNIMVQPNQPLTVAPVVISSILPTLIGACIFFPFEKYGRNGFKTFSIIAMILLVLSFVFPFLGIPNITIAYGIILVIMHIVVVLSLLYFIKRAKIISR
jgi:hypothetical protein